MKRNHPRNQLVVVKEFQTKRGLIQNEQNLFYKKMSLPFSREDFDKLCMEYGYQPPSDLSENQEVYEKCMKKVEKTLRKALEHALIIQDNRGETVLNEDCIDKMKHSVKILK